MVLFVNVVGIALVALILLFVVALFMEDDDKQRPSIIVPILGVGIAGVVIHFLFYDLSSILPFVMSNPLLMVGVLVGYLVIGALYVVGYRFRAFINDRADRINSMYSDKKERNPNLSIGDFVLGKEYTSIYGPNAHKSRITNWIIWWPLSLLSHVTYRPTEFIVRVCYNTIKDSLSKIGANAASKIISNKEMDDAKNNGIDSVIVVKE